MCYPHPSSYRQIGCIRKEVFICIWQWINVNNHVEVAKVISHCQCLSSGRASNHNSMRLFFSISSLRQKDKHPVSPSHTDTKIPLVFVSLRKHMVIPLNKYQEANGELPPNLRVYQERTQHSDFSSLLGTTQIYLLKTIMHFFEFYRLKIYFFFIHFQLN